MSQLFIILIVRFCCFLSFSKSKSVPRHFSRPETLAQTKANISLGTALASVGLLLLFTNRGLVDIIIGSIFTLLGAANILLGMRAYKLYKTVCR
ncbi:YtpI family protein [Sinobaca sp. H24]|uniref:YtpI family protein n=1 Tax=Sinobaca sp. H24 TaxID=2923376 RepID=UPI00207AC1CE|nr:YtpI family protein [Sinobaca sp. H24]